MSEFTCAKKTDCQSVFCGDFDSCFEAVVLLTVQLSLAAAPNEFAEHGNTLSLQDAIAKSLASHPELAVFTYQMQSAEAISEHAKISSAPQLMLQVEDAVGSGDFTGIDNAQTTLSISWILEGALIDKRVRLARENQSLVNVDRDIKRYDIAAQTARLYLTVLAFQQRLALTRQAEQQARSQLEIIAKRVDIGRAPLADRLRAEVNLQKRVLDVDTIAYQLKSRKRELAAQWGAKTFSFAKVSGELAGKPSLPDYASLQQAINNSPRIQSFLTRKRIVQSEVALAKVQAKNRWQLSAGLRRYESTGDYGVVAGVSIALGGEQRSRAQVSALRAKTQRLQSQADAMAMALDTQLFIFCEKLRHSAHVSDVLYLKMIPKLSEALDETFSAYQRGRYRYLDWIALQQDMVATQLDLIDAQLTAHLMAVEIERLTGITLQHISEETQ